MKSLLKLNVLYVHGAFTGCKYSIFRDRLTYNSDLLVKEEDINKHLSDKQVKIYRYIWARDKREFNLIQLLNLSNHVQTYLIEKQYTQSAQAQSSLYENIINIDPVMIVGHSLGGRFVIDTLNNYGFNKSLKKIITLNTVIDRQYKLSNLELILKIKEKRISWINYYCPWDYMMWANIVIDKHIPAGLCGISYDLVKNKFLIALPNPLIHDYALKSKNLFIKEIEGI